jgi:hypothetical protein
MSLGGPIRITTGHTIVAQPRVVSSTSQIGLRFISSGKKWNAAAALPVQQHDVEPYDVDASKPADLHKSLTAEQRKFLESAV